MRLLALSASMNAKSNFSSDGSVWSVSAAGPTSTFTLLATPAYSKLFRATCGRRQVSAMCDKGADDESYFGEVLLQLAGDHLAILGDRPREPNGGVPIAEKRSTKQATRRSAVDPPSEGADLEDALRADAAREEVQELALASVDVDLGQPVLVAVLERALERVVLRDQERRVEVVGADPVGIGLGEHGEAAVGVLGVGGVGAGHRGSRGVLYTGGGSQEGILGEAAGAHTRQTLPAEAVVRRPYRRTDSHMFPPPAPNV